MEHEAEEKDLIVGYLSKVPPFSSLTSASLKQIARIASIEKLPKRQKIFSYEDAGDKLYIVVDGKVRVGREIPGMGEEAFAILGPGAYFGELSFIDEGKRSADAIVHERCTLISIAHKSFEELLMLNQQLAYEILWEFCRTLASRLRQTDDKFAMLNMASKF